MAGERKDFTSPAIKFPGLAYFAPSFVGLRFVTLQRLPPAPASSEDGYPAIRRLHAPNLVRLVIHQNPLRPERDLQLLRATISDC